MEDIGSYSKGNISTGGGVVTEGGDLVGRDKITLQQSVKGVRITYTPQQLESRAQADSPEMHKLIDDLRAAIDHDKQLSFKEKAPLAAIVEGVRRELDSTPPNLEQLREMMRSLKSVTGEEHQPISRAADAVWNYAVRSETL